VETSTKRVRTILEIPVITGENGQWTESLIRRLVVHQKTQKGPEGTCADRQTEDEWGESKAGKGRRTSLLGKTMKYVF